MLHHINRYVVQLHRVGNRNQAAALDLKRVGLVVVAPVADVLNALLGQDVRGVEGFRQSRPHPASGSDAAELPDGVYRAADGFPLVGFPVDDPLDVAMAHQLPAGVQTFLHQGGVAFADRRVQADGSPDAPPVQRPFHPPEADAEAVVEPAEIGHVGQHLYPLGRGQHGAGHGFVDVPLLDVNDHPGRHPRIVGQLQRWPVKNRGIVGAGISHQVLRNRARDNRQKWPAPLIR